MPDQISDDELYEYVRGKFDPKSPEYQARLQEEAAAREAAKAESESLKKKSMVAGLASAIGDHGPSYNFGITVPGTNTGLSDDASAYQKESRDVLQRNRDDEAKRKADEDRALLSYLRDRQQDRQFGQRMAQDDSQFRASQMAKEEERKNKPTTAQEEADKKFASDYNDYIAGGGYAGAMDQINKLKSARDKLNNSSKTNPILGISGPTIGAAQDLLPDAAAGFINPEGRVVQQDIESAVQSSLRQTLGAQFTEREGANILKRSYDPKLSPEENVRKLDRTIKQLETAAKAKEGAVKEYEAKGTIRDYKGSLPSLGGPETQTANGGGASGDYGTANAAGGESTPPEKKEVRRQYSKSLNKTKVTYSDGSTDILDGRQ